MSRHHPAKPWRAQGDDAGEFDEIVVSNWLHIERMSKRDFWMRVGDRSFRVLLDNAGQAVVREDSPPAAKRGRGGRDRGDVG